MTADEYLSELRGYLEVLPQIESDAALRFYKKEFERAGSDTSAMLRLGNPYSLAKRIISESSDFNKSEQYINLKKDGMTNAVSDSHSVINTDYIKHYNNRNLSSDYSANTETGYNPSGSSIHINPAYSPKEKYPEDSRNVKSAYSPSEKYPENVPRIKTADNVKPSVGYIPPPRGSGKSPRKERFKTKKFVLGCLIGFMILGFTFATAVYIDEVWTYPGENGESHPVRVYETYAYPVENPEGFTELIINGVSDDGSSYQGMPLQTEEFAERAESINITLENTDVEIVYGETLRITHTDSVMVDFSGEFLSLTNEQSGGYVKIEIPETDLGNSLTLKITSGNVTVEDLILSRLSLDVSSEAVIDFINITVSDRADISDHGSSKISFINSLLNDTTVNCFETDLSFINTTFIESLSITNPTYMTEFNNCKFTLDTLFDFTNN
jgi:hypothetical protein